MTRPLEAGDKDAAVTSGIDDPTLLQPKLHGGDDENDREQHPAHRGRVAHATEAEGVLHDLLHDDARRTRRTALRHHPDLVEHLDVVDQADDDDEETRRREERKGDVPETAPSS